MLKCLYAEVPFAQNVAFQRTFMYGLLSRGGGGGTPIYGLYRYVPRDRVWFLRFSVLK